MLGILGSSGGAAPDTLITSMSTTEWEGV